MDAKLNHSDLTALLAKQAEMQGIKAELFTKAFFEIILEGLEKDGMVKINGLGTFKVTDVASRSSVNVNTGEKIEIKGHKKLSFLPADALKEKVNQPFAMFEPVEIDDNYVDDNEETAVDEPEQEEEQGSDVAIIAQEPVAEAAEEMLPNADETAKELPEDGNEPAMQENIGDSVAEEKETESPLADTPVAPADEGEKETPAKETEPAEVKNNYPITEQVAAEDAPKKRPSIILYTLLIIAALLVVAVVYFHPRWFNAQKANNVAVTTSVASAETTTAQAVEKELPDSVASSKEVPAVKEEPYTFAMLDELAAKSVGSVGRGDTLLYVADGTIATHTVAADETLVRIAQKYYGDKRLWPYLVQYNKLHNPNGLSKGMELLIPRLQPAK